MEIHLVDIQEICDNKWDIYLYHRTRFNIYLLDDILDIEIRNVLSDEWLKTKHYNNLIKVDVSKLNFERYVTLKRNKIGRSFSFKSIIDCFISELTSCKTEHGEYTGYFVVTYGLAARIYFVLEHDIDMFIDFYFSDKHRIIQFVKNDGDKLNIIYGTQTKACKRI